MAAASPAAAWRTACCKVRPPSLPDSSRSSICPSWDCITACKAAGGENPGFERLQALDSFAAEYAVAGPVQMPGHVSAYRRRKVAHPVTGERVDALVLVPTRG